MENRDLKLDSGFWYLASPYSKYSMGTEAAFRHVCKLVGKLLSAGIHCYSPIAHTHPVAKYGGLDPLDHEIYLPMDREIFKHAHGILVAQMPGWDESYGISVEIAEFQAAEKPVFFLQWPSGNVL